MNSRDEKHNGNSGGWYRCMSKKKCTLGTWLMYALDWVPFFIINSSFLVYKMSQKIVKKIPLHFPRAQGCFLKRLGFFFFRPTVQNPKLFGAHWHMTENPLIVEGGTLKYFRTARWVQGAVVRAQQDRAFKSWLINFTFQPGWSKPCGASQAF